MITSITFKISFFYRQKLISYTVDKMHIGYSEDFKDFYRLSAQTGNRDFVKQNGVWIICSGPKLKEELIKLVGEAIEVSESLGLPNPNQKKGLY